MFIILSTFDHILSQLFLYFYWLQNYINQHYKNWLSFVGIFLFLVIGMQLLFPNTLTPPRTYIGGKSFGLQLKSSVVTKINNINKANATIALRDKQIVLGLNSIGLSVDANATVTKASSYRWYERLVPFSLFSIKEQPSYVLSSLDHAKASTFADSLQQYNSSAINADIKIWNIAAIVDPSQDGYEYKPEVVKQTLSHDSISSNLLVIIPASVTSPEITTTAAQSVANALQTRLASPLTITAAQHSITISPETIASWIELNKDVQKGKITVTYSRDKIKQSLSTFNSKLYISQASNTITLVDGEVISQSAGSKGQMLELETSTDAVILALTTNQKSATAIVHSVSHQTTYNRTYTRSSKGIQALINDWTRVNSGIYGVSFRYLPGGIDAEYNGGRLFTSASLYKLYVADAVYNKINNGELSLDTLTSIGSTVEYCIDVMIVRSDNNCAIALGNMVGWNAIMGLLQSQGFSSSNVVSGQFLTTANDTARLLVKLQDGSLMPNRSSASLISMMSRQIYRAGIPAGSTGSTANKVGFQGGLNHDAAIVYHPKGSYVLVVLSSGSSFRSIADLSHKISTIMNQ